MKIFAEEIVDGLRCIARVFCFIQAPSNREVTSRQVSKGFRHQRKRPSRVGFMSKAFHAQDAHRLVRASLGGMEPGSASPKSRPVSHPIFFFSMILLYFYSYLLSFRLADDRHRDPFRLTRPCCLQLCYPKVRYIEVHCVKSQVSTWPLSYHHGKEPY
jgi:hypothetical protein